jgi:hypothetical protein
MMIDMQSMTIGYYQWMSKMGSALLKNTVDMLNVTLENMAPLGRSQGRDSLPGTNPVDQTTKSSTQDVISTLTHELRTPLTSIQAISGILKDNPDLDSVERTQLLDVISQESQRLTGVIDEVIDLTDLELGGGVWQLDQVDLGEVIQNALEQVAPLLTQKNIELHVRLPERVPLLKADRGRIKQVVVSMLSNAIKYCDNSAGWVGVRLQNRGDALQVDISDNGPGLNAGSGERLCVTCARPVSGVLGQEPQTTSLGLLISRHTVSHYGGDLWFHCEMDHGAKFSFTLPLTNR